MQVITKYFPDLTPTQIQQLESLYGLYQEWNQKINVISRKDIDHLYLRHVLHSLSIARLFNFKPGTRIIDIGTGGGFPGIPLAIYFPQVEFYLIDSIAKKIKVVNAVAEAIELQNVVARQENAKLVKGSFDFVVSRAVAPLKELAAWSRSLIGKGSKHDFKNGLICLKGGDVDAEIKEVRYEVAKYPIRELFEEAFFEEKYVLMVNDE